MNLKLLSQEDENLANSIIDSINEILDFESDSSQYIKVTENKKAILLFGSWGTGKTKLIEYALNKRIKDINSSSKNKNITKKVISYLLTADNEYLEKLHSKEILYISVFGLKNKQEVLQAILKQYLEKTGNTEEKRKLSQTILNIGSSLFKLNKELFDAGNPIDLITLEKTVNKILNNKIIIIDDLERIGSFESFIELISFINNSQQNSTKNCFVLIANKTVLYDNYEIARNKSSYLQMNTGIDFVLEKILSAQFKISESLNKVLNFLDSIEPIGKWQNVNFGFYNKLILVFELYNLRFLKDTTETLNNFIIENQYNEDYMKRSIYIIILFVKYLTTFLKEEFKYEKTIANDIFAKDAIVSGLLFLVKNYCPTNESFLNNINIYYDTIEQYNELKIKDAKFSELVTRQLKIPQERYQNIIKNKRKKDYVEEFKNYISNYSPSPERAFFKTKTKIKKEDKINIKISNISKMEEKLKNILIPSYDSFISKPIDELHKYRYKQFFLENYLPQIKEDNLLEENEFKWLSAFFQNDNHAYENWMKFYYEITNLILNKEEEEIIKNLDKNDNNELANAYLIFFYNNLKNLGIQIDKFNFEFIKKLIYTVMYYNGEEKIMLDWYEDSINEIKTELFQQDFHNFELAIKQVNPLIKEPYKYNKKDVLNYFLFISENIEKLTISNANTLFFLKNALDKYLQEEVINVISQIENNIDIIIHNNENYSNYYDLYNGEMQPELKKLINNSNTAIDVSMSDSKHTILFLEINETYKVREYKQNFFNLVSEMFKNMMYTAGHIDTENIIELDELDQKTIKEISNMNLNDIINKYYKNNDLYLLHNMRIIFLNDKNPFEIKNNNIRVFFKKIKESFEKYLQELDDNYFYIWLFFAYYKQYYYTALQKIEDVSK
jgi:hypothetical protein